MKTTPPQRSCTRLRMARTGCFGASSTSVSPDPTYFAKQTFFSVIVAVSLVLGPYWVAPFLLISRSCPEPSTQRCAVALFVYIIGVSIMMIADVWKYVQLKAKKGLLQKGHSRWFAILTMRAK